MAMNTVIDFVLWVIDIIIFRFDDDRGTRFNINGMGTTFNIADASCEGFQEKETEKKDKETEEGEKQGRFKGMLIWIHEKENTPGRFIQLWGLTRLLEIFYIIIYVQALDGLKEGD